MVGLSDESRRLKEFMSSEPDMVTDGTLSQLARTMASLSSLSVQLQRFFADTEVGDVSGWRRGGVGFELVRRFAAVM